MSEDMYKSALNARRETIPDIAEYPCGVCQYITNPFDVAANIVGPLPMSLIKHR